MSDRIASFLFFCGVAAFVGLLVAALVVVTHFTVKYW